MNAATVAKILGAWFVASWPLAALVGKLLKGASRAYLPPGAELEQEQSCRNGVA